MPKKHQISVTSPAKLTPGAKINLPETPSIPITQQKVTFSIECCDGKCCFNKIREQRDKSDFASTLHELSQLTWGAINQDSRKAFGYETLDHIKVNRNKLPPGARVIGFIYHDNHRMLGYRDRTGMFHILWFDYDGKRYRH